MTDTDTQDVCTSDSPLDHDQAARLDERIRRMAKAAKGNLDALNELIEKAKAGQIHATLRYASWTAYLTDALGELCAGLDGDTRREISILLHHQGMSIRDAAQATGQSKSTVHREVSQSRTAQDSANATLGHDGKVRVRQRDGLTEVTEARRKPITKAFQKARVDVTRVVDRVALLTDDDRFGESPRHVRRPTGLRTRRSAEFCGDGSTGLRIRPVACPRSTRRVGGG